ncbi:MAG: ribosome small subunit-dependent GTPase A [Ancalomicrobiaceae bacterium]|nr:ribosome small subunit-dependent GTPase A [Ancalomicrobiaceae bacterium]
MQRLGWQPHFAQQTSIDDISRTPPVRVVAVHRSGLRILGDGIDTEIPPRLDATVGDWLLFETECPASSRVLQRKSLFKRRAPGTGRQIQLIAANVDTAFIVSSCNQDFNVARLERYVAAAFEAGAEPVIVLTKLDLCPDPERYASGAGAISGQVPVVLLNALSGEAKTNLTAWLKPGRTIACLGSSGVGKSTLVNALSGRQAVATQGIRDNDDKGRHTTTSRQLHFLPDGCLMLDTPGMRELQLADAEEGIAEVFADLNALAKRCRFGDCRHESEPGCAVRAAIEAGTIDAARIARWRKLVREDAFNSASLAERRARDRAFGKMVRSVVKQQEKDQK